MSPRAVSAIAVVAALTAATVSAQSLGDVAAREAARRRAVTSPARVLTNEDVKETRRPMTPPAPAPAAAAAAEEGDERPRQALSPARYVAGGLPMIPPQAVAGGEVLLELNVTAEGRVSGVTAIRQTPPFTAALMMAVRGWTFEPAQDVAVPPAGAPVDLTTRRPAASTVVVMGLFRPPSLFTGTLGQPPETVARSSDAAPAPTGQAVMPLYPPNAMFDGVTMAELSLSATGALDATTIVRSAPGFDQPTLDAVRTLSFRPPLVHGRPARAYAYVVAAFRQPLTQ
ncbi:MAG: energy transducer TonB [Vicinamibacterales bacterium]